MVIERLLLFLLLLSSNRHRLEFSSNLVSDFTRPSSQSLAESFQRTYRKRAPRPSIISNWWAIERLRGRACATFLNQGHQFQHSSAFCLPFDASRFLQNSRIVSSTWDVAISLEFDWARFRPEEKLHGWHLMIERNNGILLNNEHFILHILYRT